MYVHSVFKFVDINIPKLLNYQEMHNYSIKQQNIHLTKNNQILE